MALITTATVDVGVIENWDRPAGQDNPIPIGKMEYGDLVAIPLKAAGNESLWTLTVTLPRNYVWVPTRFKLQTFSESEADLAQWEPCMLGTTVDGVGDTVDPFIVGAITVGIAEISFLIADTGASSVIKPFEILPNQFPSHAIECGQGAGSLNLSWFDTNGSETAITNVLYRITCLQYTIDQFRKFPIHTPQQITMPV